MTHCHLDDVDHGEGESFKIGASLRLWGSLRAGALLLNIRRRDVPVPCDVCIPDERTVVLDYRFAVTAVVTGSFSLERAGGKFFLVSIGGILLGLVVGWLAEQFHKRVDDALIEITVSLLTPFVAFLSAQRLDVSGVLAVVTSGLYLVCRIPELLNFDSRLQSGQVWGMVEFLLNGFVFILIGL